MKELLDYLRARLGPDVDYETPPTRLSGGFDTTTMGFTLSGAPPEYGGGLILRVMPRPDTAVRVRREAATHAALIGAGFPAPRILVAETDPAVLGKPFLIMQRLAGDTLWASAVGPNGRLGRIAGMSRTRFAEHFRARIGRTPIDYLTVWRMTVARQLLARGKPVKSVALQVGYQSAAAFSRVFSRVTGQAPRNSNDASLKGLNPISPSRRPHE